MREAAAQGGVRRQESDGLKQHGERRQRELVILSVNNDCTIRGLRGVVSTRAEEARSRERGRPLLCQGLSHAVSVCQSEGRSLPCAVTLREPDVCQSH